MLDLLYIFQACGDGEEKESVGSKCSSGEVAAGAVLVARVWELTPLVQQENHVLNVETTAEVTAQVR